MADVNWTECYKIWQEYEGLRLEAYPDPASGDEPWTVGYGHTGSLSGAKVTRGMTITKEQAIDFMKADLLQVWKNLQPLIKVELSDNQWAALVSFAGNVKWTSVKSSSVIKYINDGRLAEVPGRMALYRLGSGKIMPGLVRRRAAEGALWMKATTAEIKADKNEAQGTTAAPAPTKKFWDTGAIGAVITFLASQSDAIKKLVGNITSAFGIPPIYLFIALAVGFAGWTIWSKWRGDK